MNMLLVRCPKCGQTMRCQPKKGNISEKTKRCVYCGTSFKIVPKSQNNRVVRIVKKGE